MNISYLRLFILLVIFLFSGAANSFSQQALPITFGKISADDFNINSVLIDSNSNSVIVADYGDTKFIGNTKGWFTYVFKKQKRIKILDKKGFGLATVKILLYRNEESQEKVENINAVTYNLENNKVTEIKLSAKDVYEERVDKNYTYKKFTLPGVKEGSVIEYTYTIKSDFAFNLPAWEFQSDDCPTLWSEYNVNIPGLLNYMSFFQGSHPFYVNNGTEGFQYYTINSPRNQGSPYPAMEGERLTVSTPTNIHRWVMKDVPVFKVENYISSPLNFIDRISFQLYKTFDGQNYHDVANNWKKVTDELMQRDDFGAPLNQDNVWLDDILEDAVKSNGDQLQTARDIYYYVQKNFTCTDRYNKYIKTNLKDVIKRKSGTVGDINLLLIALLKRKFINALPVLLSTTEYGRNDPTYPLMEKLNYVICQAKISSVDYYLDATQPFLGFGKLPLNCYNGHARVISKDTTALYLLPDSINEHSLSSVIISVTGKNELEASYKREMGLYESIDIKNRIAKSGLENYVMDLKNHYPEDMHIHNEVVDSFQAPEKNVSLQFDFSLSSLFNSEIVYFNPLFGEGVKKNPFFSTERSYPVEMPYRPDEVYILYMEIPNGYKIDELPKSQLIRLDDNRGVFEYIINSDANSIQLRRKLVLFKTNFSSTDYQLLRDFYALVVKKDAEQIVFKKIN